MHICYRAPYDSIIIRQAIPLFYRDRIYLLNCLYAGSIVSMGYWHAYAEHDEAKLNSTVSLIMAALGCYVIFANRERDADARIISGEASVGEAFSDDVYPFFDRNEFYTILYAYKDTFGIGAAPEVTKHTLTLDAARQRLGQNIKPTEIFHNYIPEWIIVIAMEFTFNFFCVELPRIARSDAFRWGDLLDYGIYSIIYCGKDLALFSLILLYLTRRLKLRLTDDALATLFVHFIISGTSTSIIPLSGFPIVCFVWFVLIFFVFPTLAELPRLRAKDLIEEHGNHGNGNHAVQLFAPAPVLVPAPMGNIPEEVESSILGGQAPVPRMRGAQSAGA